MANFFPRWTNTLPLKLAICLALTGAVVTGGVTAYFTPKYTRVGYEPSQPIPFSHKIHAGQLGLDCRYCHSYVEEGGHSNVPSSSTCWNCHQHVKKGSEKLKPLYRSIDEGNVMVQEGEPDHYDGKPIPWVRVHKLPDYVYFNHATHVNRGVSCVSCHGQVDEMDVVYHKEPLSMGWCLDCHRYPENHLRPLEEVFNLKWEPGEGTDQETIGKNLKALWKIQPPEHCGACHR
jgi:hypothetical protein